MVSKNGTDSADKLWQTPFFGFGHERREAVTALQRELLQAYETASHAWVARVQAEVAMWSDFTTKLAATRSAPEALDACSKCVSQQMQMAAEDGRRLFAEGQKITQQINRSLTSGWPAGST
jgi:hypothetical protein